MKKMIIKLTIITSLVLVVFLFFRLAPQLGAPAKGARKIRMDNSPHFENGIFQNPIVTKMDAPPFSVMKEFFKNDPLRKPANPIQNVVIDKRRYEQAGDNEILVTWLGHSTILLKIGGKTFLTDPVFSKRASIFSFFGPTKFEYEIEYTIDDLPAIDAVILSHDHYDHLDYKFILKMKNRVKHFYMPLGVGAHLERWGVDPSKITELDWWESANYDGVELVATPARHFTGRRFNDRFKTFWCGWVIQSNNQKVYFTGDSGYFKGFKEIGEKYGPFDIAFIECGQYNLAWHAIHMMPEESAQAGIDLQTTLAMPIHWGKFKLSIHSWTEPPTRFIGKANEIALKYTTPIIGETFTTIGYPTKAWWKQ